MLGLLNLPGGVVFGNFTLDWTTRHGVSLRALLRTEAQTFFFFFGSQKSLLLPMATPASHATTSPFSSAVVSSGTRPWCS